MRFVTLDDYAMEDVSPYVRTVDVIELRPSRTTTTHERLAAPGVLLTRDHLNTRQVRVQFAILTDDPAKRTEALSDITAWAFGGRYLKLGDRPGQQLHVVCTDPPQTMSKRKWTELCELTFTAFCCPFWEDVTPVQVFAAGVTSSAVTITPTGNVRQVPLSCVITPTADTLTTLTIAANGAEMTFSGLTVPAGESLHIDVEEGVTTANWTKADGSAVPCLRYRTGAEVIPLNTRRANSISITTNTAADMTVKARGWYW